MIKMNIIDFHTHILPAIDDGSKNIEQSMAMLNMEKENGTDIIVASPHFYANRDSAGRSLDRRKNALDSLIENLDYDSPKIACGYEVKYFSGMSEASILEKLCIMGTNILLLEMPFSQWDEQQYEDVEKIITNRNMQVILVHIERYIKYQKKKEIWNDIFELPVIGQCNTEHLFRFGARGQILKLFAEEKAQLLGSDCHNTSTRIPNLKKGRDVIEKKLGVQTLDNIDSLGEKLLKDAVLFGK